MRIHKEGRTAIAVVSAIFWLHAALPFFFNYTLYIYVPILVLLAVLLFITVRFFRVPKRMINRVENGVISPADGTIVAVERVHEPEFFKDERIKISIFMSVNNVHVNSFPIDGVVEYVAYHPGKYLIAKLPKSSTDNEHNTVVVRKDAARVVLFRQIAGFVARRIVCHLHAGDTAIQGEEMGMIRFGSRVDVFLPLDAQVYVNLNDKVVSKKTVLAYF